MAPGERNLSQPLKPQAGPGVLTGPTAPGGATVNRKKQKRRQKQAARQAAQEQQSQDSEYDLHDPRTDAFSPPPQSEHDIYHGRHDNYLPHGRNYDRGEPAEIVHSDEGYSYDPPNSSLNGEHGGYQSATKSRSKKKKKGKGNRVETVAEDEPVESYEQSQAHGKPPPPPPPPISDAALRTVQRSVSKDPIWDTSTQEERSRIKEFWLSLGEEDRKSLVKIEKEAVLRKMKEQQKHSCSCTVCGRKRTAIEEELEVLYDAYYEELEQFANHKQAGLDGTGAVLQPASMAAARGSRIQELADDAEDEYDDEDDDCSDEEYDDYSGDDTDDMPPVAAQDFFTFGNSLTVKGGILTVADDLLKNDGQKFIDMMEQLAERRMQREEQAAFPSTYYKSSQHAPPLPHDHLPPDEEDEFDDEEDDGYDSQDDYEEDEDEMDHMTEEQRMEEGRRMFQIFAARMFEQRVLTAYREKVARERQQKLIEELEAESLADTQRDAKRARDAEKKKAKKQQQKQKQAEEKARRDEQKAAEEAAAKEAEAKKQEELRQKREEQRKKKEAERKALEDERLRKEAERHRRQEEERNRQQDAERKAREQKAEEKKRKEEARKREREEKEAKEQAAREAKEKQDRDRKIKADEAAAARGSQKRNSVSHSAGSHGAASTGAAAASDTGGKRSHAPTVVALPPSLKQQKSYTSQPSPQAKIATPVLPKAPTPSGSQAQSTSSHTPDSTTKSKQSTPPRSAAQSSATSQPSQQGRNPARLPTMTQPPINAPPPHVVSPPPGMSNPPSNIPFAGAAGPGPPGAFPGHGPPGAPYGRQTSMYQHVPQPGYAPRQFPQVHTAPGHPAPAPGLPQHTRNFSPEATQPPPPAKPAGAVGPPAAHTERVSAHSRQASQEMARLVEPDAAPPIGTATQPIARPAPIKRPASTKLGDDGSSADIDDLSKHLGSSALLDDTDEPLPLGMGQENRRMHAAPGAPPLGTSPMGGLGLSGPPFEPGFARQPPLDSWRMASGFSNNAMPNAGWSNAAPGPAAGWGAHPSLAHTHAHGHTHGHAMPARPGNSRHVVVRVLACQACQRLTSQKPGLSNLGAGFHDVGEVLRLMDSLRPANEAPIQSSELRQILDTEGDAHNGGGSFVVNADAHNRTFMSWLPDSSYAGFNVGGQGHVVGEIGSPLAGPGGIPGLGGRGF